jgi:hypothetical protein
MRFEFYTDKTVAQAMAALNDRLHAKGSPLDGWVEKNGHFSLTTTSRVYGRLERRTRLDGKVERSSGVTVIRGSVPTGLPREKLPIFFAALGIAALALLLSGRLLVGVLVVPAAAAMYIPLVGDDLNSGMLVNEVQRTLKAKTTAPKMATPKQTTTEVKTARPTPKPTLNPRPPVSRKKELKLNTEARKSAGQRNRVTEKR